MGDFWRLQPLVCGKELKNTWTLRVCQIPASSRKSNCFRRLGKKHPFQPKKAVSPKNAPGSKWQWDKGLTSRLARPPRPFGTAHFAATAFGTPARAPSMSFQPTKGRNKGCCSNICDGLSFLLKGASYDSTTCYLGFCAFTVLKKRLCTALHLIKYSSSVRRPVSLALTLLLKRESFPTTSSHISHPQTWGFGIH